MRDKNNTNEGNNVSNKYNKYFKLFVKKITLLNNIIRNKLLSIMRLNEKKNRKKRKGIPTEDMNMDISYIEAQLLRNEKYHKMIHEQPKLIIITKIVINAIRRQVKAAIVAITILIKVPVVLKEDSHMYYEFFRKKFVQLKTTYTCVTNKIFKGYMRTLSFIGRLVRLARTGNFKTTIPALYNGIVNSFVFILDCTAFILCKFARAMCSTLISGSDIFVFVYRFRNYSKNRSFTDSLILFMYRSILIIAIAVILSFL